MHTARVGVYTADVSESVSGHVTAAVSVETRPSPSACGSKPTGTRRNRRVNELRSAAHSDSQTGVGLDREARESSASRTFFMRVKVTHPHGKPGGGLAASLPG